jgi:hypothetical protein
MPCVGCDWAESGGDCHVHRMDPTLSTTMRDAGPDQTWTPRNDSAGTRLGIPMWTTAPQRAA